MKLARILLLAACAAALMVLPAVARAATYCVNSPGCSGTNEPDLQTALNAAMASTTETDTVQVGDPGPPPGGGYGYTDSGNPANEVHLIGAGTAQTVLTGSGSAALSVLGPGSSIANLTVQLPNANSAGIGTSGSLSNVNITSLDAGGHSQQGVILLGNGNQQWHNGSVTLPSSGSGSYVAIGRSGSGETVDLEDLSVVAKDEGIITSAGDNATLRRVSVASGVGVVGQGTHMTIDELAFRSLGTPDIFLVVEPSGGFDATADVNHATAFGVGLPGEPALLVSSSTTSRSATANLRNSIVRNFFFPVDRTANGSSTAANVSVSYSDIGLVHSLDSNSSGGTGSITTGPGVVDTDPLLANPAAGDFSLKPGSPAIDAGDPAGLQAGDSSTDLAGAPRISNGRQDMGALEFQFVPPPAPDRTPPTATIAKLPKRLKLKQLVKGFSFSVTPSEASSIDATLAGSASSVHLTKTFNLTLAHKTLGLAAGKRTIKLKAKKKLLGRSRKFTLQLRLALTDAAGNKTTLKRAIKVR